MDWYCLGAAVLGAVGLGLLIYACCGPDPLFGDEELPPDDHL